MPAFGARRSFASVFLRRLGARALVGLFLSVSCRRRLADRLAVVEAEHDDDDVRLLGGEDALRRGSPIGGLALGLILDQAGVDFVFADHAHIGLFGIGVLKAVSQPVRHRVAEHQHISLRYGLALLLRRRLGKILHYPPWRLTPRHLLLIWRERIVAEPAAATALRVLLLPTEVAKIEELRRRRSDDPEQQRDRDGQYE